MLIILDVTVLLLILYAVKVLLDLQKEITKSKEELKSFVAGQLELREVFYNRAQYIADRSVQNHNQLIRFLATKSLDLLPK